MKLPELFRQKRSTTAQPAGITRQDYAERLLADGLRLISRLALKMANVLETQRLQRQGYDPQGKWLERIDRRPPSDSER